ncbi:MAG: hypothetical protein ACRCYY_11920 [Trueperaceae bacterium]
MLPLKWLIWTNASRRSLKRVGQSFKVANTNKDVTPIWMARRILAPCSSYSRIMSEGGKGLKSRRQS